MITAAQAADIRQREARYGVWLAGRTSVRTADIPVWTPSREERSALEVYDFITTPPTRYFAYVRINPDGATVPGSMAVDVPTYGSFTYGMHRVTVGTWTGEPLNAGPVTLGAVYRSNMGDKRRSVRFKAINGHTYAGTFYQSAGGYCHIKRVKG